ncbi:hypothetical protein JCM14036_18400 [Desulfotomaculum defluvii]
MKKLSTKFKKGFKDFAITTIAFLITYFVVNYAIDGPAFDIDWDIIGVYVLATLVTIVIINGFKD